MPELKPCPFCGGEANVFGNYDDSEYHANCTNNECGCCWVNHYDTEEEAIEAWNRRTQYTIERLSERKTGGKFGKSDNGKLFFD